MIGLWWLQYAYQKQINKNLDTAWDIVKEIQGFSVRFVGEYMELSPLVCEDDAHRACSQVC